MNKDKNHNSPLDNPSLKKQVFQAPADYFNQLEGRLMDHINAREGELANAEHLKENIFEVPQGYFNQLEDHINGKLEGEAATLENNDHLKSPIFKVPSSYFETLEGRIDERLEDQAEVKVIPLYKKSWFRVAIAAVLVAGLFWINRPSPAIDGGEISDELILDYLSEDLDIDYELMALSDDFDGVINDIMLDETFGIDFDTQSNLELEYDFEYFEQ